MLSTQSERTGTAFVRDKHRIWQPSVQQVEAQQSQPSFRTVLCTSGELSADSKGVRTARSVRALRLRQTVVALWVSAGRGLVTPVAVCRLCSIEVKRIVISDQRDYLDSFSASHAALLLVYERIEFAELLLLVRRSLPATDSASWQLIASSSSSFSSLFGGRI